MVWCLLRCLYRLYVLGSMEWCLLRCVYRHYVLSSMVWCLLRCLYILYVLSSMVWCLLRYLYRLYVLSSMVWCLLRCEFTPGFLWGSCYSIFSFICMFCRSLFVLLYFFFWPLCCLFFFDIRILIAPLVSSNSSWNKWQILTSLSRYMLVWQVCRCLVRICRFIPEKKRYVSLWRKLHRYGGYNGLLQLSG
jgi:hypothetical protein